MSSASNEDTNNNDTNSSTRQDSGQTTAEGQGYTVDSTIKHKQQQGKDTATATIGSNDTTTTIASGADPAAVATGSPPPQQQRLEDDTRTDEREQPVNQE
jgi:hypothetical protein